MSNKYGDKYRVHNWVKFNYSQIGEYIDENHTDRPLRNDELVDLLNKQEERIKEETDRVIKLEQYIYTKLCPKSEHYDEGALSEIINTILGDVDD